MNGGELRTVPASEAMAFSRAEELAFGHVPAEDDVAGLASLFDPQWAIAVYDAGRIVATTSANSFELTLPAGPGQPLRVVSVPGVTAVGVHPTHRRRGLLNQLMARQLADFRERQVPLAILTASESVIYGRYGYGLASSYQSVAIRTERSAYAAVAGQSSGQMRLLDAAEAGKVIPGIYDRLRQLRPGEISRSDPYWAEVLRDPERRRFGGGGRFYAIHESPEGEPDGYATYRYHHDWPDGVPSHRVAVEDLYAASTSVQAALWRFVLDLDLVAEVTAESRPVDDPLRWQLADPRQLRTTSVGDHLWVRLIDIPAALAKRGYSAEEELVLEVRPEPGAAPERYVLSTARAEGSCRPAAAGDRTDLVLGLPELGAIYLGGVRPSVLAAAGRIDERRPGVLARADAAFASPLAPFCNTDF